MKELWDKAREYGRVQLFTMDDGTHSCRIEFHTLNNIVLEAKSGFNNKTPEEALEKAIINAKLIVGELVAEADKLKRLS